MEEIAYQINIKPLSVNNCWQWKRFKTRKYCMYERLLLTSLPKDLIIPDWPLKLYIKRWFSSKLSDRDNPIKPFQDILQEKYNFNDSRIYKWVVEKEIVKKWKEYVLFSIQSYNGKSLKTNKV